MLSEVSPRIITPIIIVLYRGAFHAQKKSTQIGPKRCFLEVSSHCHTCSLERNFSPTSNWD
jgi:hypothetical protein